MAVNVNLSFGGFGSVRESLALGFASHNSIIQWGNLIRRTINLTDGTNPATTAAWAGTITIASSAGALDLTALTRTGQPDLDLTDKKVIAWVIENTGSAVISLEGGATNPYELFSLDENGVLDVAPGGVVQGYYGSSLALVSATVKAIDLTGTDDDVCRIVIAAG